MKSWEKNKINKRNRASNSACPADPDYLFYLEGCCLSSSPTVDIVNTYPDHL